MDTPELKASPVNGDRRPRGTKNGVFRRTPQQSAAGPQARPARGARSSTRAVPSAAPSVELLMESGEESRPWTEARS